MKSHLVHELIHDECGTCHIAGVLHNRDEEIEDKNLWQEHDDRAHTTDDTVYKHCLDGSLWHQASDGIAQHAHKRVDPVHGI